MAGRGSEMTRMTRGPSSASHERPSREREATLGRGAAESCSERSPAPRADSQPRRASAYGRGRAALRLLFLFVIAVITVACAGITSPGRGIAGRPTVVELAGSGVDAARSAVTSQFGRRRRQWRDGVERPVMYREAVEADVDDDDAHTRWGIAGAAPVALRGISMPRKPGRALRGEAQSDTSRFAIRRGFPRGPPA